MTDDLFRNRKTNGRSKTGGIGTEWTLEDKSGVILSDCLIWS